MTTAALTPATVAATGGHDLLTITHTTPTSGLPTITPKTTAATITGTGDNPHSGILAQAHRGVLVLDNATQIRRPLLDLVRNTIDRGSLYLAHGTTSHEIPAQFRTIITTCGEAPRKIGGPLLDLCDITTTADLNALAAAQPDPDAHAAQTSRLAPYGIESNGHAPMTLLAGDLHPGKAALAHLDRALDRAEISLRAYLRTLRLSWTLADLTGATTPGPEEIDDAMTLRARP